MPRGIKGSGRPAYKSRARRCSDACQVLDNAKNLLEEAKATFEADTDQQPGALDSAFDAIENAMTEVDNGQGQLQELADEMEEWRSNIEEKFSQTDRYSRVEAAAQDLQSVVDTLDNISWPDTDKDDRKDPDFESLVTEIDTVLGEIDDAMSTAENVDFPTMYG